MKTPTKEEEIMIGALQEIGRDLMNWTKGEFDDVSIADLIDDWAVIIDVAFEKLEKKL